MEEGSEKKSEVKHEKATRYLFWGIIAIIIVLSYLVLKGFLIAIAGAFILAYLLKPIYDRIEKKTNKPVAALASISLVIILILIIIGSLVGSLISQLSEFTGQGIIDEIANGVKNLPYKEVITDNLSEIIIKGGTYVIGLVSASVSEIPTKIVQLFVTLFVAYYILIDWDRLKRKISEILPFKNKHYVMEKIETVIEDVIVGTFLLALIEAFIITVGFALLGVKFAILLGFLVGLFAFIPALGPLIVWVPVALIELSLGNIGTAIGVTIIGLIVSSYVDSIIRIKLVGGKSKIHPAIMLVGLFGGIQIFGLIGFILGPLILSILLIIMENIPKIEGLH